MNADTLSANTTKCKKAEKRPDVHCNPVDHQEARGASSKALDNSINQSLEQKRKSHTDSTQQPSTNASPSLAKNTYPATGKHQTHKLVDNKQLSKLFNQSDKKTFLLDTYARIVATNNRRCSKRLRDLSKPKRQVCNDQNEDCTNFDLNWHTGKASTMTAKSATTNSKIKQLH